MADLVTLGETMVAFDPNETGLMRHSTLYAPRAAGSESNVAIGLARLGFEAHWISRLGKDEFAEFLLRSIRGEGVDTHGVSFDAERPTGLMFKERLGTGEQRVYYYRRGSAASAVKPEDVPTAAITGARFLFLSGITPALSESARETCFHLADLAKQNGVQFALDPNLRRKLWTEEQARPVLTALARKADLVLTGRDELALLGPWNDQPTTDDALQQMAHELLESGVKIVAVKDGANGAYVFAPGGQHYTPAYPVTAVDTTGAGDAFDAGFIAGLLENLPLERCLYQASVMGALATTVRGDIEGLPDMENLRRYMEKPLQSGGHNR